MVDFSKIKAEGNETVSVKGKSVPKKYIAAAVVGVVVLLGVLAAAFGTSP